VQRSPFPGRIALIATQIVLARVRLGLPKRLGLLPPSEDGLLPLARNLGERADHGPGDGFDCDGILGPCLVLEALVLCPMQMRRELSRDDNELVFYHSVHVVGISALDHKPA
jgi:hypothetical protein